MGLLKELRKMSIFRKSSEASSAKGAVEASASTASDTSQAALNADPFVPNKVGKGERRLDGGAVLLSEGDLSRLQGDSVCSTAVSSTCDGGDLQTTLQSTALDISDDSPIVDRTESPAKGEELLSPVSLSAAAVVDRSSSSTKEEVRDLTEASNVLVNFEKPLDQIYEGIGEAFGVMIASSLKSTKWDKRSQALKGMATVLKGLDGGRGMAPPGSTGVLGKGLSPDTRIRCWRLACEMLHHTMKDKVMPVRLAAHDLFVDAFSNTEGIVEQEEIDVAAGVLVEHLIERLGDSNLRMHESTRKCVLFCADHPGLLGLGRVLSRLRARLAKKTKGGERTKVHFGILDTVNFLLMHFPARRAGVVEDGDEAPSSSNSWREQDVRDFIVSGMDETLGERVKSSASALAVTVYQTFGMEAMAPLFEKLRPAKQAFLKQACQQAEEAGMGYDGDEDDGDEGMELGNAADFSDLVICGTGMKPPPGAFLPPLDGAPSAPVAGADDEECLMDGILEDAGMVFSGAGLTQEGFGRLSPINRGVGHSNSFVDEEQRILEEELLQMGIMDFEEGIDEQQALLDSLAEVSGEECSSPEGLRRGNRGAAADMSSSMKSFDQCILEEVF